MLTYDQKNITCSLRKFVNLIIIQFLIVACTLQLSAQTPFEFKEGSVLVTVGSANMQETDTKAVTIDFEGETQRDFYLAFKDLNWSISCPITVGTLTINADMSTLGGDAECVEADLLKFTMGKTEQKVRIKAIKNGEVHLKIPVLVSLKRKKKVKTYNDVIERIIKIKGIQKVEESTAKPSNTPVELEKVPLPDPELEEVATIDNKKSQAPISSQVKKPTKPIVVDNPPAKQHTQQPISTPVESQVTKTTSPVESPKAITPTASPDKQQPIAESRKAKKKVTPKKPSKETQPQEEIAEEVEEEAEEEISLDDPLITNESKEFVASIHQIENGVEFDISSGKSPYLIRILDDKNLVVFQNKVAQSAPFTSTISLDKLNLLNGNYLVSIKDARRNKSFEENLTYTDAFEVNTSSMFESRTFIMTVLFLALAVIFSFLFVKMNLFKSFIRS